MRTNAQGLKPFVMTNLKTLDGVAEVVKFIETRGMLQKSASAAISVKNSHPAAARRRQARDLQAGEGIDSDASVTAPGATVPARRAASSGSSTGVSASGCMRCGHRCATRSASVGCESSQRSMAPAPGSSTSSMCCTAGWARPWWVRVRSLQGVTALRHDLAQHAAQAVAAARPLHGAGIGQVFALARYGGLEHGPPASRKARQHDGRAKPPGQATLAHVSPKL
jgi:hypothetical protein